MYYCLHLGNRDVIDITGEIWEDDFDTEDDDWYLEYSFLDDKPKQSKKELTEPTHRPYILNDEQLRNTDPHLQTLGPNPDLYQTKHQGQLRQKEAKRYLESQTQIRQVSRDQYVTKEKCNSFTMPDMTAYKPLSSVTMKNEKQAIAEPKQQPKPSLFEPNIWKPPISRNNIPRPSSINRRLNIPMHRSNFNLSNNASTPYESSAKPSSGKFSLRGDFVTASDVADARKKQGNGMSNTGRSINEKISCSGGFRQYQFKRLHENFVTASDAGDERKKQANGKINTGSSINEDASSSGGFRQDHLIRLCEDFVTASDVGDARKMRENERGNLRMSINEIISNPGGLHKDHFTKAQKECNFRKQEPGKTQSLARSQHFISNTSFGKRNRINSQIISKISTTLSTDQDAIPPLTQFFLKVNIRICLVQRMKMILSMAY